MTTQVDADLFDFANRIASEAATLTLSWFQKPDLKIDLKEDATEVTDADKAVEEYLRNEIGKNFPHDTIIGEEEDMSHGSSARKWIIDPIDGTASFVRGVPLFSSLLALIDDHGPAIGTIYLPALGEYIAAGRGLGALSSQTIPAVSNVKKIKDSCISSSSFDMPWWPEKPLKAILSSGAKTRTWGDGYGYFLVATGQIDAMIDPSLYIYDIAPMLTVIPECGGLITTWEGESVLLDRNGWVATNTHLHDSILELLQ
ncbi:MAG: inositol monophosphatase family protein [Acidimicrobiales bacterium]|jgi:histidinol phosphatase-like enzyme (inositol monophosphatase family)|nr:inositol monophosphatase family protein [Acidimicrobiales bacterium]MDP6322755.1 inositol monophosphatase family protein [Acidimicrobiales bacterium]HJM27984.1 inositol monophosphatase family protein [Acidimicrobiales bacterium]HJM97361.1 inositol monophosphatase family protein [Acidimicrobiales bacterium]